MEDPRILATVVTAALIGLVIVAGTVLKAWHDWVDLQRLALTGGRSERRETSPSAARIELADLKERVRKLEAIAAGVDL